MGKIKRRKVTLSRKKKYYVLFDTLAFFSTFILVILSWIFNSISAIDESWFLPKVGFRLVVWDTLRVMKRYDGITCDRIGDGADKPSQWDQYLWMSDNATEGELLGMMDLDDGNLIGFGFKILLYRNYQEMTFLLKRHDDYKNKEIHEKCGCIGDIYPLQNFLIKEFLRIKIINRNKEFKRL